MEFYARTFYTCLQIKTRLLSCYCDNCFDSQYNECENCEWVKPWDEVEIEQEGSTRRVTRHETVDQRVGIKDLITENSIVAIASGGPGEDFYLMKVTVCHPEELDVPTKDDWEAQLSSSKRGKKKSSSEPLASKDTTEVHIRGPDDQVASRTFYVSDTTQAAFNSGITFKHTDIYRG
ncbi:hypothetical protein ACROYT_G014752 [Oculina patagonica]